MFAIVAVYVLEARLIWKFAKRKINRKDTSPQERSKSAIAIHILAVIGIICFTYGYFIEPYWIDVKTVTLHTHKLKNTSLRIVQISDLHCEMKLRNEKKLAGIINPLKPDIIVFTGDGLNLREALPVFQETLNQLKASIGKYAVQGNLDVWYRRKLNLFEHTGFTVLDENSIEISKNGELFFISGVATDNTRTYEQLLTNLPDTAFSIFLCHYPGLIENLSEFNVDLYLAGHTHGGQVALPFYGALITLARHGKKYEAGKYVVGNTTLYINRGIGMEGGRAPRVRFMSRPEITVFDIKPAN